MDIDFSEEDQELICKTWHTVNFEDAKYKDTPPEVLQLQLHNMIFLAEELFEIFRTIWKSSRGGNIINLCGAVYAMRNAKDVRHPNLYISWFKGNVTDPNPTRRERESNYRLLDEYYVACDAMGQGGDFEMLAEFHTVPEGAPVLGPAHLHYYTEYSMKSKAPLLAITPLLGQRTKKLDGPPYGCNSAVRLVMEPDKSRLNKLCVWQTQEGRRPQSKEERNRPRSRSSSRNRNKDKIRSKSKDKPSKDRPRSRSTSRRRDQNLIRSPKEVPALDNITIGLENFDLTDDVKASDGEPKALESRRGRLPTSDDSNAADNAAEEVEDTFPLKRSTPKLPFDQIRRKGPVTPRRVVVKEEEELSTLEGSSGVIQEDESLVL